MIRFIDVNTGNVYNGDKPYVHWFDGKQSINLNYDKQFIILTDTDQVEIEIHSDVFYLVDNHKIGYYKDEKGRDVERTFNDKNYYDLDVLKSNYVYHNYTDGAKIGDFYVYSFNIVAQGKYVGEITDTFTINGEEFTVGADFIDENESLGINLANFGAEISNEVQRAIYEAPLDEHMTDYVLINRKFKELLNEYINILGNKGSYKSLINSLNWFEYGDIVKLYEYWKHAEPNKNYLSKKDITQFVNEYTEELLYSNAKTTFVGISAALEKVKLQNDEIVYENYIDESKIIEEPTFWGYSPLQYDEFFANAQWCTIYNKDKTITFRLAVDREITGFAPQISFEGTYVGMEYKEGYYEYTTTEKYEYGELLPEVWFFWLACYYGVIRVDLPYTKIGSKNNKNDVILPDGWNWVISGGIDNTLSLLNEPNPDLEKVSMIWSKEDMSLKMVLLGNFFSTYFLPIHLDLIHCTIENIVYANTLKAATLPRFERTDIFDEINEIKCEIEKLYHLKNIETFTNPNTPFGFNHKTNFDETDEALEILGVEEKLDPFTAPLDRAKVYHMQHFKGIGVMIPVKCTLCNVKDTAVITDASIKVYKYHTNGTQIIIDHTIERETDNIVHVSENYVIDKEKPAKESEIESIEEEWERVYPGEEIPSKDKKYDPIEVDGKKYLKDENGDFYEAKRDSRVVIDFNILIREIGQYKVQLLFRRSDGITYIKTLDFEVDGENHPLLNMYKIVPRYTQLEMSGGYFNIKRWIDTEREHDENDKSLPFGHVADYVFSPIQWSLKYSDEENPRIEDRTIYTQFISATRENIYNTVHTNQVFIIKAKRGTGKLGVDYNYIQNILITKTNTLNTFIRLNDIISNVNETTGISSYKNDTLDFKDVVWFSMDRGCHFVDPIDPNTTISEWTVDEEYIYIIGINTSPNMESTKSSKYLIGGNVDKRKIWLRDMFIPYFYKLEKFGETTFFDRVMNDYSTEDLYKIRTASNTYELEKTDVVCFLPELRCVRRPEEFMWKYICKTNNTEITPLLFRRGDMEIIKEYDEDTGLTNHIKVIPNDNKYTETTPYPAILQPLFGRYDFSILPDVGYYDVIFNYKLDDKEKENQTKTISSQFIVKK